VEKSTLEPAGFEPETFHTKHQGSLLDF
jgi:hypothetical protein